MSHHLEAQLQELLQQWRHQITTRMESATHETNAHGRQAIEHGAVCIYNCAIELGHILNSGQAAQQAITSPDLQPQEAEPCQVVECSTAPHSCPPELPGLDQYLHAHADRCRALRQSHQLAAKLAEAPRPEH